MNEDPSAASPDAPVGASAPVPSSGTPAPAPSTRTTSRFYSRMGRAAKPAVAPGAAAASSEPVSLDSLTAEQAVLLKDNLPIRATAAPGTEAREFDAPRGDRPPREGGFDRERRGPGGPGGRDRDRGRGRDRDRGGDREGGREQGRDREGGPDRGFERDRDRDRPRFENRPADAVAPAPQSGTPADEPASLETHEAPPLAPPPAAMPDAPRKLRFEDAPTHDTQRTVQEFRPSHDRDFNRDAERTRAEREKRDAPPAEKASGLFGWMKSIFTPKPGENEEAGAKPADDRPRDRERNRGPRSQNGPRQGGPGQGQGSGQHGSGHGQGPGQGGGGGGGEQGGQRRRRRRGGRNRNRNREGGPGGPGGGGGGGGSDVGGQD